MTMSSVFAPAVRSAWVRNDGSFSKMHVIETLPTVKRHGQTACGLRVPRGADVRGFANASNGWLLDRCDRCESISV